VCVVRVMRRVAVRVMRLLLYVSLCIHIYVSDTHVFGRVSHDYLYVYTYVCMCICECVCIYVCTRHAQSGESFMSIYVSMYAYIYIYKRRCMYADS